MGDSTRPNINKDNTVAEFESKFLNVYDFRYAEGRHYYNATRHKFDDQVVFKSDEEFLNMLPDAVTCVIVVKQKGEEPKLLLTYEFRYPTGQYLLCPTAGLMDPSDKEEKNPLFATAIREIKEETGIAVNEMNCKLSVINPLLFSTPGMTDESNAIVLAEIELEDLSVLSTDGAEDSEHFDGFELYSVSEAREIMKNGRDKNGRFYSVYTWIALVWFVMNY